MSGKIGPDPRNLACIKLAGRVRPPGCHQFTFTGGYTNRWDRYPDRSRSHQYPGINCHSNPGQSNASADPY